MLRKVKAKVIFTTAPQIDVAKKAAEQSGIQADRIYICNLPDLTNPNGFRTLSDIMTAGASLTALEPLNWPPGEAARRIAFLSHSSGTTGLPVRPRMSNLTFLL